MKKLNNQGFGAVEILLTIVVIAILGFVGYRAYQVYTDKTSNDKELSSRSTRKENQDQLKTYTIDNEELIFDYNPNISAVKQLSAEESKATGTYTVETEVTTGAVDLLVTTGVSNIGGTVLCGAGNRDICKVVDTKASTYLGKPITYRLVEAKLLEDCGYAGVPSCNKVPLATSYIIDDFDVDKPTAGGLATIVSDGRNLGKKAKDAGLVLVDIRPSKKINNANLFKNPDFLETVKIIETMRYKQ